MATSPPPGPPPTQDECTMSALAHGLSFLGFLPPLIIFLLKRQSRFVSFHALQCLLWHICYAFLVIGMVVVFFTSFIFTVMAHSLPKGGPPPLGVFLFFPLVWLVLAGGGVINLVLIIVFAIKASQGEWANYPIFGGLARRILKMNPVGPA